LNNVPIFVQISAANRGLAKQSTATPDNGACSEEPEDPARTVAVPRTTSPVW
jgi:hypothetical protein